MKRGDQGAMAPTQIETWGQVKVCPLHKFGVFLTTQISYSFLTIIDTAVCPGHIEVLKDRTAHTD